MIQRSWCTPVLFVPCRIVRLRAATPDATPSTGMGFSYTDTTGTVVELRVPTLPESEGATRRLSLALSPHLGVALPATALTGSMGNFQPPQWWVTRSASEPATSCGLTTALSHLPATQQDSAVRAHLDQMAQLRHHRDQLLSGAPVCAGCVTVDTSAHFSEVDDALACFALELSAAVTGGTLTVTPTPQPS